MLSHAIAVGLLAGSPGSTSFEISTIFIIKLPPCAVTCYYLPLCMQLCYRNAANKRNISYGKIFCSHTDGLCLSLRM